jgi:hypothetical protein
MVTEDPLGELLSPRVMRNGLPALLRVPDPVASVVSVDNVEGTTALLFGLLGSIVHRDPQLLGTADSRIADVDSPDRPEAFRKVVVFVAWFLKDEQIREKFLSDAIDKPSALSFAHFIRSPEEPDLTDVIKLERGLIWSFLMGLTKSQMMVFTGGTLGSIFPSRPERIVLDTISSLASAAASRGDAHSSAAAAMTDCLAFAAKHDVRVGEEKERVRLQATANFILQVHELPHFSRAERLICSKIWFEEGGSTLRATAKPCSANLRFSYGSGSQRNKARRHHLPN